MSASLVGSEMCIRDSHEMKGAPYYSQLASFGEKVAAHVPRKAKKIEPVSYTHLTLPTICSV
eukprot:12064822-Alexandrium_andersonii.AAC.1